MIDNDSLRHALGTLERHAPAEAEVLAGMRAGIARRRRRRQVASVAGVAGAASAVALGVVLVAPGRGNDHGGASPPAAVPPTSAKIATPLAAPALPFSVGWVPDGYRLDAWSAGSTDGSAQYVGSKDFQTVVVWVSAKPRDRAEGDTEEPTEIAGRPGVIRRVSPDRLDTQLIWQLADGRWAMVGGRAPTVSLMMLHKVAKGVSTQPTPMTVSLGLKAVPAGYEHTTWNGGGPMSGMVTLCRGEIEPHADMLAAGCIKLSLQEGTAPPGVTVKAVPGRTVNETIEIPVDQEKVVNGVLTRASADGEIVYAQVDAEHWVHVMTKKAGVDLLREVASNVTAK